MNMPLLAWIFGFENYIAGNNPQFIQLRVIYNVAEFVRKCDVKKLHYFHSTPPAQPTSSDQVLMIN